MIFHSKLWHIYCLSIKSLTSDVKPDPLITYASEYITTKLKLSIRVKITNERKTTVSTEGS